VDWKPERAIQAKVRDSKKKEEEKEKYTQKKSNDYLKGEFERYLGSVQKWRLFAKLRSIGLYPAVFWLKGFIPTMFVSSPVILSPFKVTKYLYCDAGPLFDLPMFASIVLPLYCHLSFIHIHSCIHNMHTDIIHAWLHCQSYFNCTESVIRNVIQKCYQSSIFQVADPIKTTFYQYILISLVLSPVWSLSQ